jgi:hypothetical protein
MVTELNYLNLNIIIQQLIFKGISKKKFILQITQFQYLGFFPLKVGTRVYLLNNNLEIWTKHTCFLFWVDVDSLS